LSGIKYVGGNPTRFLDASSDFVKAALSGPEFTKVSMMTRPHFLQTISPVTGSQTRALSLQLGHMLAVWLSMIFTRYHLFFYVVKA